MIRETLTATLRDLGWSRRRREWQLANEDGDLVLVGLQRYSVEPGEFFINVSLVPRLFSEFHAARDHYVEPPSSLDGIVRHRLEPGIADPDLCESGRVWSGVAEDAEELARTLRDELDPLARALLVPETALATMLERSGWKSVSKAHRVYLLLCASRGFGDHVQESCDLIAAELGSDGAEWLRARVSDAP